MIRATFTDIPTLILLMDSPADVVEFVRAWRGFTDEGHPIVADPAPTSHPPTATRPRLEPAPAQLRTVNGLLPPPEHLPGGMVFDALGDEPLTTLAVSDLTGIKERDALILLERLTKAGFAQKRGVVKNTHGHRDVTWVRTPEVAEVKRKAQRWEEPPATADHHRASPNRGSIADRIFSNLTREWETTLQLAERLGISKKQCASACARLHDRVQVERRGPNQGQRGYFYEYRRRAS